MIFEKRQKVFILGLFFLTILIFPLDAQAYLDPGTGSIIIQAVIAAVAAVGLYVGIFWRKIRSLFSSSKKKEEQKEKDKKNSKKTDGEQEENTQQ